MVYLGVDLHRKRSVVTALAEDGGEIDAASRLSRASICRSAALLPIPGSLLACCHVGAQRRSKTGRDCRLPETRTLCLRWV